MFATLGDDAVAFGKRVQGELPVKAYALWQGVGGGEPVEFDDPADICALFNALAGTSIASEAETVTTDDYTSFGFTFADGSRFSVMFDSMALEVSEGGTWKAYAIDPGPGLDDFASLAKEHTQSTYK